METTNGWCGQANALKQLTNISECRKGQDKTLTTMKQEEYKPGHFDVAKELEESRHLG